MLNFIDFDYILKVRLEIALFRRLLVKKICSSKRRYPIGAEWSKKGVDFRVWAPDHKKVTLIVEPPSADPIPITMDKEAGGYFSKFVSELEPGTLYRYRLSDGKWYPDPASRFQPLGVNHPSSVIDPHFDWTDDNWPGVEREGQIIYEMHIGTFTQEGTFKAAKNELKELAKVGITLIEVMPLNEFPGHFGWGYDGVNLFAPSHLYGTPQDVKAFINEAHALGIGVILDVVYNHLGPESNALFTYTKLYTNDKYTTEWGDAINFDHQSVREFVFTNCRYWIEEFHFDGLRIDATPWFFSETKEHILSQLTKEIHKAAPKKKKIVIGEDETQNGVLLENYKAGGYGFDSLWNDDYHHTAVVRLTGRREAYYTDYEGKSQEFISALKFGFLYQGQYYEWQKKNRGTAYLKRDPAAFITFIENHDQIANSGNGRRLHYLSDPGNYRAMACLLLLGPNTPMLFQGQEFGSSSPFYYFADHSEDLNKQVHSGRAEFLSQFPRLNSKEMRKNIPNPSAPITFTKSKLKLEEREINKEHYQLYKDLIKIRKNDPVFKLASTTPFDGAVINDDAFIIRYFGESEDRLLIVNFGSDLTYSPAPQPLLVAGKEMKWNLIFSTESAAYGGVGIPPFQNPHWHIPGHAAIVLKAKNKRANHANGKI